MLDIRQTDPKPLFVRGASLGMRLIVLSLLSVVFMIVDSRQAALEGLRNALSVVVYPIRASVDLPFSAVRWLRESLADRDRLLIENEQLRNSARETSLKMQRYDALEAENIRLRALMDSTDSVAERVLVSEIMSVDLDPFRHRIVLNKGTANGAYQGQALLDARGIVGQITRAGPLSSEAILITDAGHAIPVQNNRNGLRTIAFGTGDIDRINLPYLTHNADIGEGDLLVSSGLGGTFPAGYPVARVVAVERDPGRAFSLVSAQPAAALDRNREVLLVWTVEDASATGAAPEVAAVASGEREDVSQ